jgi:hypothetical protein
MTPEREAAIDRLKVHLAELVYLTKAGFLSVKEFNVKAYEAMFETFLPDEISPRRKAAIDRLHAATTFLLGTTALTPMPWVKRG